MKLETHVSSGKTCDYIQEREIEKSRRTVTGSGNGQTYGNIPELY